jgi:hypothetical protein
MSGDLGLLLPNFFKMNRPTGLSHGIALVATVRKGSLDVIPPIREPQGRPTTVRSRLSPQP